MVKWVDKNVVQLVSNFVGIESMTSIERWCKKRKEKERYSLSTNNKTV